MSPELRIVDPPMACQAKACEVATKDRQEVVDLLLDVACKTAIDLYRQGRPGRARYELTRAGIRVDRILGEEPS